MTIELTPPVETPVASGGRTFWSDDEKSAVAIAYGSGNKTAEDFFRVVQAHYPRGKVRTIKAYLTFLNRLGPKEDRNHAVYNDLLRLRHVEVLKERAAEEARKAAVSAIKVDPWLDEIDPSPVVPQKSGAPVQGSLFPAKSLAGTPTKAVVKPDPGAIVPVYYAIEPSLQDAPFYGAAELSRIFNVKRSRVSDALAYGYIPVVTSGDGETVITLAVFRPLYEAMCEGHAWEHACHLAAVALRPKAEPVVDSLYDEVKAEPEIGNGKLPHGKGSKLSPRDSLDDPNPDAQGSFTIEEAMAVLGLDKPDYLLSLIEQGNFPAVKESGKWQVLRADLKRVQALRADGLLSLNEALKRAGSLECEINVPVETSWTDHLAPLSVGEDGVASSAGTEVPRVLTVNSCQNDLGIIFDSIGGVVPAVTPDQHRRFTLGGLKSGVFSIEEAVKLLGEKTGLAKTVWAFNLLQCGRITVDQAVKLLG